MRSPTFSFSTRHCHLLLLSLSLQLGQVGERDNNTERRETVQMKLFCMAAKVIPHIWSQSSTYNAHTHMGHIIHFITKESLEISEKLRKICTARRTATQLCVQSPGSNSGTSGWLMVRVGEVLYSCSCFALGRAFSQTNLPKALENNS